MFLDSGFYFLVVPGWILRILGRSPVDTVDSWTFLDEHYSFQNPSTTHPKKTKKIMTVERARNKHATKEFRLPFCLP